MTTVRSVRVAACLWLLGGAVYLVTEAVAAARYPGYSYRVDYISALGVPRVSPSALPMNLGAFIAHGILFAAAGVVVVRAVPRSTRGRTTLVLLAVTNGVGNVLVGVFHAGDSSLHGLGAALAILGGNAAMIASGGVFATIGVPRAYRVLGRLAGAAGIACFVGLLAIAGADTGVEGAVERGSVYTIIGWDLLTGVVLLRSRQDWSTPPTGTLGS